MGGGRSNLGLSVSLNAPLTRLRRELPQRGSLLFEPLTPGEVARRRRDGEGLSRGSKHTDKPQFTYQIQYTTAPTRLADSAREVSHAYSPGEWT